MINHHRIAEKSDPPDYSVKERARLELLSSGGNLLSIGLDEPGRNKSLNRHRLFFEIIQPFKLAPDIGHSIRAIFSGIDVSGSENHGISDIG